MYMYCVGFVKHLIPLLMDVARPLIAICSKGSYSISYIGGAVGPGPVSMVSFGLPPVGVVSLGAPALSRAFALSIQCTSSETKASTSNAPKPKFPLLDSQARVGKLKFLG